MNQRLLDKMHNWRKDKRIVYESNLKTSSNKHKGKKEKYFDSGSSSEVNARSHK